MKLLLLLSSSFLTLLLIVHSVKTRGRKTTLAFFVSLFLFGVFRGNSVALLSESGGPYVFSDAIIKIGAADLPACIGWVFALYLSWTLAEGLLARRGELASAVFPLSAFAMVAMGCFSDAVETTACSVGWWRWNIVNRHTPFLAGGTHLFGIIEWMSVAFDFLVPFLLFRTARGARAGLAWGSLLLFPLHWASHWKYVLIPGAPNAYEIYHALIAFAVPLFLLLETPRLAKQPPHPASRAVHALPRVALAGMFVVLMVMDLGVLKSPELLISLLPLAAMAAGDRGNEKGLRWATAAACALAFGISLAAGRGIAEALLRAVPPLVPGACLLLAAGLVRPSMRRLMRRATAAGLAAGVVVTAVVMVRDKRMREEYSRLMYEAQALIDARNYGRAESLLRQAVAMNPGVNLGTKALVNAYGGQERMKEAWEYAMRSIDLNPSDYEAFQLAGQVLRNQGKFEEAIFYYERALLLNPGDVESARSLADCYARGHRYADAISALGKVLSRHPEEVELAHLQGALLIQVGDFRRALAVVQPLLERHPEDAGAHLLMAYIRAAGGDAVGARREAERTLQLNPSDPQARSLLESLPR